MHGNVLEWTQDCYNDNYNNAQSSGKAWLTGDGENRVLHGGSRFGRPGYLRSAFRFFYFRTGRGNFVGFRLVQGASKRVIFPFDFEATFLARSVLVNRVTIYFINLLPLLWKRAGGGILSQQAALCN